MNDNTDSRKIHTRIWQEEPEADNPFATRSARLRGYDVYGEMLGRARWVEILYLLFRDDAPTRAQADLLEQLAVALANPGPRDASVHAAMCGGVGGSTSAACLIAALAVGAGFGSGSREVFTAMQGWSTCHNDLGAWRDWLSAATQEKNSGVWRTPEHPPGFEPYGISASTIVQQTLARLAEFRIGPSLPWLAANRGALEDAAKRPLALSGVTAAALTDLGFTPEQGEMLHLLLRLPGAAAHALEQRKYGYKKFPFFALDLVNDPAANNPQADTTS